MYHGIMNVYKEKGFTSHDVVAKMRGILGQKKIGHTGTLDPDAEGVLPVCVGAGTKLCDMLTDKTKIYETQFCLGYTTDTQDASGTVLSRKEINCTKEQVEMAILSFLGDYEQMPPMYSAIKVNGKKLYELAREGIEIERKKRPVTIYHLNIKEINLPYVTMEVECSKGTYIRTLCYDIGEKLGCGATMEKLLRTRVGSFLLEDALTLKQIEAARDQDTLVQCITPVENVFADYQSIVIKPAFERFLDNGNQFFISQTVPGNSLVKSLKDGEMVKVYNEKEHFYGVYSFCKERELFKPEKLFPM